MARETETGLLLRFRDLVTESGGNIREHRQIIDDLGFAWWGWWARSQEILPRTELANLLEKSSDFPIVLFDSGMMQFYYARCSKISVSPVEAGIASPDFRATPHYYVRGNYPAWFKIHGKLEPIGSDSFLISGRPTLPNEGPVKQEEFNADGLRKENPTLWLIDFWETQND